MRKVEFLDKHGNLLRYDETDECYQYRQYSEDWSVRVKGETLPYLKVAPQQYIPLIPTDTQGIFNIPKDKYENSLREASREEGHTYVNLASFAGLLHLYENDHDDYNRLEPPLYIQAGSLSDSDFESIIFRLKQLAFLGIGPTVAPQKASVSLEEQHRKQAQTDSPDALLISIAERFIEMCEAIESAWHLITKNPAQETKLSPQVIDLSQPKRFTAQMAQHQAKRADTRRIEVLQPAYSYNTSENRFLVFAIQEIEKKYEMLCNRLSERAEQLMQRRDNEGEPPIPRTREAIQSPRQMSNDNEPTRWRRQVRESEEIGKKMSSLKEVIEPLAQKAVSHKTAHFLSQILDLPAYPDNPSIKLTQSEGYGNVYHAYLNYREIEKSVVFVPMRKGLIQALRNKSLYPVHRLYELWVLIEVYDVLVNRFGFRPITSQDVFHPLQLLDAEGGDLIEMNLSGKSFQLQFVAQNVPSFVINATLKYDSEISLPNNREGHYYRPDLYLEIEHDGQIQKFAIDAKYRRYQVPLTKKKKQEALMRYGIAVHTVFEDDLFVTSKKKYLETLQSQSAFIIHSDPSPDYTFWGGTKYPENRTPDARFEPERFPDHQFGAICVTPNRLTEIERLLKCFLMYHADIHKVCWNCRKKVEPVEEVKENKKPTRPFYNSVGWFYQCPTCSAWWKRTWCQTIREFARRGNEEGGHPLIKIGKQTFHTPDPNYDGSIYFCPKCGRTIVKIGHGYTKVDYFTDE